MDTAELLHLLRQLRRKDALANEETVKMTVIQPILRAVGWDTFDTAEVLYEYQVGERKGGGKVDIVLKSGSRGRVVALIEAKGPNEDLGRHVAQVLKYAFHEGSDICVLTSGVEWWLFLPRESGPPLDRRFAVLDLTTTPAEQLAEDFKAFLGKETLANGSAYRQAERVLKAHRTKALLEQKIPEIWRGMHTEPDSELVELIVKRVYDRIGIRPDQAQVQATLHGTPMPHSAPPKTVPEQPAAPDSPSRQPHPVESADSETTTPEASEQPASEQPVLERPTDASTRETSRSSKPEFSEQSAPDSASPPDPPAADPVLDPPAADPVLDPPPSAERVSPLKRFFNVSLADLLEAGCIEENAAIKMRHQGQEHSATIRADGQVASLPDGTLHSSLSGAARHVSGSSRNGWATWRTLDGCKLDDLRWRLRANRFPGDGHDYSESYAREKRSLAARWVEHALAHGLDPGEPNREASDELLASGGYTASTIDSYKRHLSQWFEMCNPAKPQQ